jgi:hypothetical protein
MKKIILCISTCLLALTFTPNTMHASNPGRTELPGDTITTINSLESRISEISSMDKSTMNNKEKRALKKELKTDQNELRTINGGGIYISVGALIIIILLLIILF